MCVSVSVYMCVCVCVFALLSISIIGASIFTESFNIEFLIWQCLSSPHSQSSPESLKLSFLIVLSMIHEF